MVYFDFYVMDFNCFLCQILLSKSQRDAQLPDAVPQNEHLVPSERIHDVFYIIAVMLIRIITIVVVVVVVVILITAFITAILGEHLLGFAFAALLLDGLDQLFASQGDVFARGV